MQQPIRQGDVILIPTEDLDGIRLPHLILAEGEVTGHKHQIVNGQATLYRTYLGSEQGGALFLKVISETATLSHEEHKAIQIPQGTWMIRIQREYNPEQEWGQYVAD
jgi:hypothetical protein